MEEKNKRTNYSQKFLSNKKQVQLQNFCKKNKIPYLNLNKEKMAQNIIEWQNGATELEEFTHKGLHKSLYPIKGNRRITIRIRRFCFEYSTQGESISKTEWGKRFGVSSVTISNWLKSEKVQELIKTFQESYEDRIMQKFADNEEIVFNQLLNVINQKRNTDVKRKAINDFFGYRGRINVNEQSSTNVTVNQKQQANSIAAVQNNINMTEEEINAEIKELEELE